MAHPEWAAQPTCCPVGDDVSKGTVIGDADAGVEDWAAQPPGPKKA